MSKFYNNQSTNDNKTYVVVLNDYINETSFSKSIESSSVKCLRRCPSCKLNQRCERVYFCERVFLQKSVFFFFEKKSKAQTPT